MSTLLQLSRDLIKSINQVHACPKYIYVWTLHQQINGKYTGATYLEQFKKLEQFIENRDRYLANQLWSRLYPERKSFDEIDEMARVEWIRFVQTFLQIIHE